MDEKSEKLKKLCRLDSHPASSLVPSTSTDTILVQVDLNESLLADTKVAFASLIALILKLDITDSDSEKCSNLDFRRNTVSLLTNQLTIPPKVSKEIVKLSEKEAEEDDDNDVIPYIVEIRRDPFIQSNTAIVLIAELVALFVRTGIYDSRYRVLLHHLSALFGIPWEDVENTEDKIAHLLRERTFEESQEAVTAREKQEKSKKIKRYAAIGVSGAVGGVLIGLTGGLAAPLVAAGAGVVLGGMAAGIATTAGAAVLGSAFGVAGAGLAGYKMQKRVGAVEEFVVETLSEGQSLHVAICVSGWIEDEREETFRWAWRHLNLSSEQYCLRYETQYLLQLGKAMDYFMRMALTSAVQLTLMETALATLVSAIAWPMAVMGVASVIDNPWNTCIRRAEEVGHILAEILLTRQQGQRPVTLLGFSMGARVIFHCLCEMSRRPNSQGIIQDVVFLGAPITGSAKEWRSMCSVVGGRAINGYCTNDFLLKFLYRTMSAQMSIAGIAPVEGTGERKIVNFNLTHIISGHMDYREKMKDCLDAVGVRSRPHNPDSVQSLASAVGSPPNRRLSNIRSPSFPIALSDLSLQQHQQQNQQSSNDQNEESSLSPSPTTS